MKLLNRKNLEIVKLASNDETRAALNGLLIDGNTTVASNGHIAIEVKAEALPSEDWPANSVKWSAEEKPFIMDRKTVEKVLKNIPKKTSMPILQNVATGLIQVEEGSAKKYVCQTTDLDRTENLEARTIEGIFPKYQQIIPPFESEALYQRVGISAGYLKEVCSILEKYKDSKMITLYVRKDQDAVKASEGVKAKEAVQGANFPIVLTAEDENKTKATAVIMPMRL